MSEPVVGIVMGSDSDWPMMEPAALALDEFGVPYEAHVVSAEKAPVTQDLAGGFPQVVSAQPETSTDPTPRSRSTTPDVNYARARQTPRNPRNP